MSALPEHAPRPAFEAPADIAATAEISDWRTRTWWPIGIVEANEIAAAQAHRALGFVAALDPEKARDAALLALPNILAYGRAIVMAAIAVKRASDMGVRFISHTPEFAFLDSGEGAIPDRSASILPPVSIRHEFARRVMRVHSWSGLWRTVPAMLRPDILAISHNTLLHRAASGSRERVGFRHADLISRGRTFVPRWRRRSRRPGYRQGSRADIVGRRCSGRTVDWPYLAAARDDGCAASRPRDARHRRAARGRFAFADMERFGRALCAARGRIGSSSPRWRGRSLRPRKAEGVCGVSRFRCSRGIFGVVEIRCRHRGNRRDFATLQRSRSRPLAKEYRNRRS